MNTAYLLLGSNLNDRQGMLSDARELVESGVGSIISASSVYETEPWGFESDQLFLNQVVKVSTLMAPVDLLTTIHSIEEQLGRKTSPEGVYVSRVIDIDILFYNEHVLNLDGLVIPHPRMHHRRFTLLPMSELNHKLVHPKLNKSIQKLLKSCDDDMAVELFEFFHPDSITVK
jgi:2-amino-4-hydroxy-6-hydroxymethyldihydropteridine diphosphokinase